MSNKDSLFVRYLNTKLDKKLAFTVQDKCLNLLGNDFVNKKLNDLNASRKDLAKSFFKDIEGKNRVKINSINK
jgi:hypothetical protein